MTTRDIICFANSTKHGGLCFAGKTIAKKNWIRPVYEDATKGICKEHERYAHNGTIPQLLDIVRVPLKTHDRNATTTHARQPNILEHQPENVLLDKEKQ